MRELLFLAHRIPYPPDKGDKIRSFHILRHLSGRFRIHLGCFSDDAEAPRDVATLAGICADVFCLPLSRTAKIMQAARALVTGTSISEASYRDSRMQEWVDNKISSGCANNAFVFCSAMYPYVEHHAQNMRVIMDMVDVDSEKWGDYAGSAPWPLRSIYKRERRTLFSLERRAAMMCDCCLFVSSAEAGLFRRLVPQAGRTLRHIDNGVDLGRFSPAEKFSSPFAPGTLPIVFTGVMDYRPNADAVTWFAREVMPAVRRVHAPAEFWIVGKNPPAGVRRLRRLSGIRVTGAVADVRPYLANASCVVAPLRIARGVQNKVLEAMAMAKPVVLTPPALEGLAAIPERDVLVGKTAEEIARLASEVLAGKWPDIGRAARRYVEEGHRWETNLKALDLLLAPSAEDSEARANAFAAAP